MVIRIGRLGRIVPRPRKVWRTRIRLHPDLVDPARVFPGHLPTPLSQNIIRGQIGAGPGIAWGAGIGSRPDDIKIG